MQDTRLRITADIVKILQNWYVYYMGSPISYSIKSEGLPILLLVASFILGGYFYSLFPQQVATHWNFQGEPNGFSGKFFGAWFLPILTVSLYGLFLVLPKIDPKKERYAEFAAAYHIFKGLIVLIIFLIFITTGFYNLGYNLPIGKLVPAAVGLLMVVLGILMPKIKPNWFMGIRTPWTLSNKDVWNKTHRLGGHLFMLFGLGLILTPFLPPSISPIILFGGAGAIVIGTFLYSCLLYRQGKENNLQ